MVHTTTTTTKSAVLCGLWNGDRTAPTDPARFPPSLTLVSSPAPGEDDGGGGGGLADPRTFEGEKKLHHHPGWPSSLFPMPTAAGEVNE